MEDVSIPFCSYVFYIQLSFSHYYVVSVSLTRPQMIYLPSPSEPSKIQDQFRDSIKMSILS
jgi:hypothetical protein